MCNIIERPSCSSSDLKPENLLLDSQDNLKITDFGLSSIVPNKHGGRKLLMTTCGTPNYVAPEVIKEKGYDGFMADVWSIGVILFVMLTGRLPFEDKSIESLFKKIEAGKVTYPKDLSSDGKDLVQRMLQVNPKKRITVQQILNHKWVRKDWIGEEPPLVANPLSVSSAHISNAVKESFSRKVQDDKFDIGEEKPRLMNAFELTSQFMMGSLRTMATGEIIKRHTRFMSRGDAQSVKQRIKDALDDVRTNFVDKKTLEVCDIPCRDDYSMMSSQNIMARPREYTFIHQHYSSTNVAIHVLTHGDGDETDPSLPCCPLCL